MKSGEYNNNKNAVRHGPSQAFSNGSKATGANAVFEAIVATRSDLSGQPCVMPGQGLSSFVFLFTDEVIKAPRDGQDEKAFLREYRVLNHLHQAGLPVPAALMSNDKPAFFSQERMAYHRHFFAANVAPNTPAEDTAAADIAEFLFKTHQAVTPADARRLGYHDQSGALGMIKELAQQSSIARILAISDHDLADELADYARSRKGQAQRFFHSDLNPSNMLVDENSRICGFIDFGRCHYGDIAVSFHTLYHHYTHAFVDKIADHYGALTGEKPIRHESAVRARLASDIIGYAQLLNEPSSPEQSEKVKSYEGWLNHLVDEYDMARISPVQKMSMQHFGGAAF